MSRETLKSFLNLKGFADDSISPGYNKAGHAARGEGFDLGKDSGTGEELLDLANEQIGLLGDYLNYVVENANNIFGISPGNEESASSKRGDSLVVAEEQGASSVFVEAGTAEYSKLSENSNSGYFTGEEESLADLLDKTGNSSNSHKLLSSIDGKDMSSFGETLSGQEGENNKVVKAVEGVLFRNNRFANVARKNAYAPKGQSYQNFESGDSEIGNQSSQKSFGKFDFNDSVINLDQLKSVGHSLLYKASGYDSGVQPGQSEDINELHDKILGEEVIASTISGTGASKLNFSKLRSKYAYGAPSDETGNSTRDNRGEFLSDSEAGETRSTFGTNYNSTVNFNGPGRKILKLKAALACLALKKVTKDFMSEIGEFIKFGELEAIASSTEDYVSLDRTYTGPGPYTMGAYRQLSVIELDMFKKIVLVQTDYPYSECFEKGIEIFFGASDDIDKIKKYDHVSQAPGYWLSVASSMLKSFDQLSGAFKGMESYESDSVDMINTLVNIVSSNKLIQFANAAATVGDVFFKSNGGLRTSSKASNRPYDVDSMPSTPATRVGKSRDSGAESPLALSWRQSSVPSMYLLPRNLIKAASDLNNIFDGQSPARGMLTSNLVKNTYLDKDLGGSNNRIPNDIVKRLEDKLEAEYVPFYIQDLRTNEVISFHAFLNSLTDNIKSEFSPVSGYGRMDPVQIYKSTSRTVGVSFIIYATSKEDFDNMWYKINKLTTLLYPQWTQGTQLSDTGADRFVQPFSQVIGASPIVRLRVGDVIKSNYSRFNLARMFGIGDENINPVIGSSDSPFKLIQKAKDAMAGEAFMKYSEVMVNIFYGIMGSPLQYIPTSGDNRGKTLGLTVARNFASNFLINGFVNPLGAGIILRNLIDPNTRAIEGPGSLSIASGAELLANKLVNKTAETNNFGYHVPQRVLIKANMIKGYEVEDGTIVRFDRPLKAIVQKRITAGRVDSSKNKTVLDSNFKDSQTYDGDNNTARIRYVVTIIDLAGPLSLLNKKIKVDHQYLMPDPKDLFMFGPGALLGLAQPFSFLDYLATFLDEATAALGTGTELTQLARDLYATSPEQFMQPENNPFTRALESNKGRGLAGVIDGINFNWMNGDFTWETDYNSRAPRGCEISFNMNVIHDLPPGLDHSGYNKAPLYNVGSVMKEVQGDAHGDDVGAEFEYKRRGNGIFSKTGK